jgi:chromosome segregation ATPase
MSSLYSELENLYDQDFMNGGDGNAILEWLIRHREEIDNIEINYLNDISTSQDRIADLEAKLAEREKNLALCEELRSVEDTENTKALRKTDDALIRRIKQCNDLIFEKMQLKQQLADTDKLMQEYLNKCLNLEQQLAEKEEAKAKLREMQDGSICD